MSNYIKITKAKARKLFNAGKCIFLHTNKMKWENAWQNPMSVFREGEHGEIYNFDATVNNYSYYNCDNERGNIVIYLIKQ